MPGVVPTLTVIASRLLVLVYLMPGEQIRHIQVIAKMHGPQAAARFSRGLSRRFDRRLGGITLGKYRIHLTLALDVGLAGGNGFLAHRLEQPTGLLKLFLVSSSSSARSSTCDGPG